MKRITGLLLMLWVSIAMAQPPSFEGTKSTSSVLTQKVIPPLPTAASLGKYGDQQINMFTGTSAVSIPIYEVKTNGFSLPLSLSYSNNGLRVTEAASWVGLGWSVGGTGVITRVVKGAPDGAKNPINIKYWPLPTSYTGVSDAAWNYIHSTLAGGGFDQEPDLYIVRGGKLNFKFFFDLNNRIQTIPYNNNVKIKYDNALNQYTITDDDGSQYIFGGSQSTEETSSSNPIYASYTSSWFLSKIISPVGSQILFNNSKGSNQIMQDQYSESEEVRAIGQGGNCGMISVAGRIVQYNTQSTFPVFLNSIETDQEIVYFVRSATERADIPGDFSLTDIKVYSKATGKYEYNYSLTYSYFPQVSTVCWGSTATPQHVHNTTAICKRLRLDAFTEKGYESNTGGYKVYSFQYNTKPVPARCSLDQDYWGYYNGASNTSLLPTVGDPDFNGSSFNAVSREANHSYSDAGMLQKIIYPTGGETDFTYEPNQVTTINTGSGFQSVTASISGISPSTVATTTFTLANIQAVTVSFNLSDANLVDQGLQRKVEILDATGGIVYSAMNFSTPPSGVIVFNSLTTTYGGLPPGTYTLKVSRNYSYSSFPTIPAVGISATVTYKASGTPITETRMVGGFRVRKIVDKTDITGNDINIKEFFYDNPQFIANIKNSDCISLYSRWGTSNSVNFQCIFKSRTTSSVQPLGTIQGSQIAYERVIRVNGTNGVTNGKSEFHYSVDPDIGGYSLSPLYRPITSLDHRRGNLLSQIDFDASGNIKKILSNTYDNVLKNNCVFSFPYYTRDEPLPANINVDLLPNKVFSFSDFSLLSEWVRIKNTSETIYSGTDYITTTSEYSYGNANYPMPTTTKMVTSKNETFYDTIVYPLNYKPVSTKSNEEIERQFETDYQAIYNSFVSCSNAASTSTAKNACYTSYQSAYDNLINNRITALANYQSNFTALANAQTDPTLKGIFQLIAANKLTEAMEITKIKAPGTEMSKSTKNYKMFSGNILLEKVNQSVLGNPLDNEATANAYDSSGNLLQVTPKSGIVSSYIWNYKNKFPVAQVINASLSDIAYSSFEADGKGSWTYAGTTATDQSPTGIKSYLLNSGNITRSGVSSSGVYIVSYWSKNGPQLVNGSAYVAGRNLSGYTYYEHIVTNPAGGLVTVSGSGLIDELRLYPQKAQMTTYAYAPLIGMTTQCDANNRMVYYEYDEMHRLIVAKDQDRNVIQRYCYNYMGQPENCTIYYNTSQSGSFVRSCSGGMTGNSVTYTVPAGVYSSTVSQAVADQLALNDVTANGQNYANANGTCSATTSITAAYPFTIASSAFTSNGASVSFYFAFSWTGNPSIAWSTYNLLGTIGTNCRPSVDRVVVVAASGRVWNVKITTTGQVSVQLTSGPIPPGPNPPTYLSGGTYNL